MTMDTIRHLALGCCIATTVAGVLRVFWPENGFSAVINAVLALYIITAALQMLRGADWPALARTLRQLPDTAQQPVQQYEAYSRELGLSASAGAVQQVLAQAGVEAAVQIRGGVCCVELARESDRARAEAVLAASCGQLPWQIATGGGAA